MRLVGLWDRTGGRAYIVGWEEERWGRDRSRLGGLSWDSSDYARGRDQNFRFLLSLKEMLSKQELYTSGRRTWRSKYHVSGSSPGGGAVNGRSPISEV